MMTEQIKNKLGGVCSHARVFLSTQANHTSKHASKRLIHVLAETGFPILRSSGSTRPGTGSNLVAPTRCLEQQSRNFGSTSGTLAKVDGTGVTHPTKRSKKSTVTTPVNKDNSKSTGRKVGCIGNAKVAFYAPFFQLVIDRHGQEAVRDMILKTVEFHDRLIDSHGIKDGTKRFKEIFLFATQLLEGKKPSNPGWVATSKVNRWPTKLSHIRKLYLFIRDNTNNEFCTKEVLETRRFFLCLSKINKFLEDFAELDVKNIKKTFKIPTKVMNDFEQFVQNRLGKVVKEFNLPESLDLTASPFFSSSNGPNKVSKTESADAEAWQLLSQGEKLKESFGKWLTLTNNFGLQNYMEQRAQVHSTRMDSDPEYRKRWATVKLRVLRAVFDSGNKSRTVAICEFWTQSIFEPLENLVLRITRRIFEKNIAFYGHSAGFSKCLNFPDQEQLVSLDATEWTDNLPAGLQYIVLKKLIGSELAKLWLDLAARCPWYLGDSDQTIVYGKGQGMGTKGSFAIAQLTNLLFLEWKLQELYPHIDDHFFVEVGDDMVIQDPDFLLKAEFESIGVPINVSKSKVSTTWGNFVEFVSRNSWNGLDYSVISPGLLLKFRQNDYYSLTLLNHLRERGLDFRLSDLLDLKTSEFKNEGYAKRAEKHDQHKENILLISSLLQYGGEADHLVDNPSNHLSSLSDGNKTLKSVLANLVLVPLVKLYDHYTRKGQDRDHRIAIEKLYVLTHQYRESNLSIWAFAHKELLDLNTVRSLIAVGFINERINNRLTKGYERYTLGQTLVPDVTVPLVSETDSKESVGINPEFIRYCLILMASVNEIVIDTKLISKLSLLDKANTKALLVLMSDLNRTLNTTIVFDDSGEVKEVHYLRGKENIIISLDSLSQMIEALGLKLTMNQLKVEPDTLWVQSGSDIPIDEDQFSNGVEEEEVVAEKQTSELSQSDVQTTILPPDLK